MQERTIMIANQKTQKRYSIQSDVTTLGELKSQLSLQGIDYSGMTFTEGITKTQLISDDSLLPTNVMYHGQPTNNLVILLTNPQKQIASGAIPTNRKDFGDYIKKNNLGEAIKKAFGDNWTRISTDKLSAFFHSQSKEAAPANNKNLSEVRKALKNLDSRAQPKKECSEEASQNQTQLPDYKTAPHASTVNWFYEGIKDMVNLNLLHTEDVVVLTNLLTELSHRLLESKVEITDDEVDKMLNSIL